jgi:acetoin utilization deacetylase AcuC-like enzyme
MRGRVDGVVEPGLVDAPELAEGGRVCRDDGGPVASMSPSEKTGGGRRHGQAHQVALQHQQTGLDFEARRKEAGLLERTERIGERPVEPPLSQLVEQVSQELGGRSVTAGNHTEKGDLGASPPRADSNLLAVPVEDLGLSCAHLDGSLTGTSVLGGSGAPVAWPAVAVLFASHPRYLEHSAGPGHPERPARLEAVARGLRAAGLMDAVVSFVPRPATRAELEGVHDAAHLDALEALCRAGGGRVDADTSVVEASFEVATLAAGAGLDAVERLQAGEAAGAFLALRPPGHHALRGRSMGFCLINNVAVTAHRLAERGERVLIVDWDVHHGNGTQDIFYRDPRVIYFSLHQFPFYPGTGAMDEVGVGGGRGATVNVALPAGATGDAYRRALDEILVPLAEEQRPTWLLCSAGFDAHRADPLADMELSAGDFFDVAERVLALVPAPRRLVFLEGGYDLEALASSAAACVAAMAGERHVPEAQTSGGPGDQEIEALRRHRDYFLD